MNLAISNKSNSNGFTLLEVIIALLILGIGSIVLTQLQTNMIRSNTIAKQRTDATLLAQNTIENFRTTSANEIRGGSDKIQSDTTLFTRSWKLSNITGSNGKYTGDTEISVNVSWPDIKNTDSNDQASESTTIYLSSIISRQSFSDSAIHLKLSKSPPITPDGIPSSPTEKDKNDSSTTECSTSGIMMGNDENISESCSENGHMSGM